jgi:hypothetical protein
MRKPSPDWTDRRVGSFTVDRLDAMQITIADMLFRMQLRCQVSAAGNRIARTYLQVNLQLRTTILANYRERDSFWTTVILMKVLACTAADFIVACRSEQSREIGSSLLIGRSAGCIQAADGRCCSECSDQSAGHAHSCIATTLAPGGVRVIGLSYCKRTLRYGQTGSD